jgi:hypothetical protein
VVTRKTIGRKTEKEVGETKITECPVEEAAGMLNIGETHEIWKEHALRDDLVWLEQAKFAKVSPPPSVSDTHLDTVVKALKRAGVERIVIIPPKRAETTATIHGAPSTDIDIRSVREQVEDAVAHAVTANREALAALTNQIMGEVGL